MKKILITGSLGYLGSVLSKYLSERGYNCLGYDIGFFEKNLLHPQIDTTTYFCDARDVNEFHLKNIDVVVHLAGISNDPMGKLNPSKIYDPTRQYAFDIAKHCKKMGIKFIFASSCSIYGLGSDNLLNEDSEVFPQTGYSLNKLQIEQDLKSISDKSFSPIALRFATVFGMSPRIRFDVVINMLTGMAFTSKKIILNSNGEAWRPNLHILDLCKAVQGAIDLDYKEGELLVLNVGSNENNLKIIDIANIINKSIKGCELKFLNENPELDKEGLIRDRKVKNEDTRTYKVSFDKITKVIPNFKCDWSVENGVIDLVNKFEEHQLTLDKFQDKNFYRLQHLEYLYENNLISDELRWLKK